MGTPDDPSPPEPTDAPGLVLVVDDNAENRALVQATLDDEGYRVELASGGEEGIAKFTAVRPDCVLLDIRMPGMDGIEVCRRLRALGDAEIPILFLTAQRDVETFDRARAAGGDDYITKPILPTELVSRVASAVKQRRMAVERGELYQTVRQQRDDLMRLQLAKEELGAFIVHDLKNPVHTIDLLAQRLQRDKTARERTRDIATRVRDEASSLLRMITNLLDVTRGDVGSLVPRLAQVELRELVTSVATSLHVRASMGHVTIEVVVPGPVEVVADVDLVRRMMENLVENAIRYAPEDSFVRVTVTKREDGVELRVADRGPGIPVEQRERVFERFVQTSPASSALDDVLRGNRGLGLSFCKLVAEAHHGRIWIDDNQPGAIFCVWIPHAPS